jgi:hypothetical protein
MSYQTISGCCPFPINALQRAACLCLAAGLLLFQPHAAAAPGQKPAPQSTPTPEDTSAFNALLAKGDYAAAIQFVEQSSLSAGEKDGVTGILILDGLADKSPASRPPFPLAEGFARLERAALAGRDQSIADLRAKFTNGINDAGKNSLMAPNPALAQCWGAVESGKKKPAACVQLRKRLRVPEPVNGK